MGLLAVASAKGAPGVTTTSMLIGALWPRPSLVVECDPSGGDIALRMPSNSGQPLDPQVGLLSLVAAGRRSFHSRLVTEHSQQVVGGLDVIVGVASAEQTAGITHWQDLGRLFSGLAGTDVIADLGRVGADSPQNALLRYASAVAFVVDTVPSSVVHLRERMRRVYEQTGGGVPTYVLVVSPLNRARAVREIEDVFTRSVAQRVGVHHLAHDDAGAAFFLGQVKGNPERTRLVRSARPIVSELAERTMAYFVEAPTSPEPETDQETSAR
jgi:hypothetical protein